MAICCAVGGTQHSAGVQVIRTASILQLLLGNVGQPGAANGSPPEPTATSYCATSSTRRFLARPSSLAFEAIGEVGPAPKGVRRAAAIPCRLTSAPTTAAAGACDSLRL
jgi:anaerobic selenocysteine-containing dehydrogenase